MTDNSTFALNFINSNRLTGIKAGAERETFLDIWMVVVEDRIFARSWGFAEKSWYNTFLKEPFGQIKCGDVVLPIKASPVTDVDLNDKINRAYLEKYDHGEGSFYAQGIIQPQHVDKTMEFEVQS